MIPADVELQKLSKDELIALVKALAKNWLTVDGLWFIGVEEKYGLDAALELDYRVWELYPPTEFRRLREALHLNKKGIPGIVEMLKYMSTQLVFDYELEEVSDRKAIFKVVHCRPQESRLRGGRVVFDCKPTFVSAFEKLIEIVDPRVKLRCLFCPPEERPEGYWCGWEFTLDD